MSKLTRLNCGHSSNAFTQANHPSTNVHRHGWAEQKNNQAAEVDKTLSSPFIRCFLGNCEEGSRSWRVTASITMTITEHLTVNGNHGEYNVYVQTYVANCTGE